MQNICWTSVVHSLTNCGAYIVKIKDVQSSVQHSIDQGSLQKVVNTSLEIFSPKKIADSAFSCGLPFVLPSFIKKRSEFEIKFVSRLLEYLIHFRNLIFFSPYTFQFTELCILTTWPQSGIFRFSKTLGNQRPVNSVSWANNRRFCLHWFNCLVPMDRFMFYLIAGRLGTNNSSNVHVVSQNCSVVPFHTENVLRKEDQSKITLRQLLVLKKSPLDI